ncbi:MAG: transglycosylase domain-containing protein [bacterium]
MASSNLRNAEGSWKRQLVLWLTVLLVSVSLATFVAGELRTSRLQARYFSQFAQKLSYRLEPGPSDSISFPGPGGPYDDRLGYSYLPAMIGELTGKGFSIHAQARFSPELARATGWGIFPSYRQKSQAGLNILDHQGELLFSARYPERIFPSFESIPEWIVKTLLFIENRELLDPRHPYRNPAVEWDRLFRSALDAVQQVVGGDDQRVSGGSTLATQLEKFRHSPEGRTSSAREKARQMISASLRAYQEGAETMGARRQLILDYINSVPLAAIPGHGEVNGLCDGLWAWFGRELDATTGLPIPDSGVLEGPDIRSKALAYKQVLSLFLAHRRPSYFLLEDQKALKQLTDTYLGLLYRAGIVGPDLLEAAMSQELVFRRGAPEAQGGVFFERKAANAVRGRLSSLLDFQRLYDLDRLDLTVQSTLDRAAQQEVTRELRALKDPARASEAGLYGHRLLDPAAPSDVIYSFTLYERGQGANLLRIQTDNFDQPFDINQGVKLELGSSAKLRTLVSYLEIVADLYERYAPLSRKELLSLDLPPGDRLSRWAVEYLYGSEDKSLKAMLEAAMERTYSADPAEAFFTGGGLHTFVNFNKEDDRKVPTVREGLRDSVNLVFIRLMRDIVRYHMYRVPGSTALAVKDAQDPLRQAYLARFADQEGKVFLKRFYGKYKQKSQGEMLELLTQGVEPTPKRLAILFSATEPEAGLERFAPFLREHLPNSTLSDAEIRQIYEQYSPSRWTLADRGYLAHVHPLELWTVEYLSRHPQATLEEVLGAGTDVRQEVYNWLFKTKHQGAQKSRIRTIAEIEAFQEIHRSWKRLGYPFGSLVPSYATAIGSSADRPAALAELVGIILNGGIRYPLARIEELHFARGTPYETILRREGAAERVLRAEVADVVRAALQEVVERGTAQRLGRSAFVRADGTPIPVGGKTGTGDNRYDVYGPGARLLESRVMNRTATFAFFIGDRFFGTITAYVPQPAAAAYSFTSSLPVQILKVLAPKLMPLIEKAEARELGAPELLPEVPAPYPPDEEPAPADAERVTARNSR